MNENTSFYSCFSFTLSFSFMYNIISLINSYLAFAFCMTTLLQSGVYPVVSFDHINETKVNTLIQFIIQISYTV